MNIKAALLPLALTLLSACVSNPKPQPIPVLAEVHQCPAYPLPPEERLKPPAKTDFMPPMPLPQPTKRSSSTN